jgi:hypothetical protein
MFPAPKKVAFRAVLEEEIKNEMYTLRHSDIETQPIEVDTASSKDDEDDEDDENTNEEANEIAPTQQAQAISPKTGEKRDFSDEEDSDTCPATPVAGRRKRHRQWRWTLGPKEEQQ